MRSSTPNDIAVVPLAVLSCFLAGCAAHMAGGAAQSKRQGPEKSPAIVSDIDRPAARLAEQPDDYALIIGIEKYAQDLPDAQFAEHDAAAVKDHLRALGFPERNIKFLTGESATGKSLAAYLEDWLPRHVKENSRVFFYFAGHGAPDFETGQAYLVPSDGRPDFIETTGYPVKKLYAKLSALKAKRVIVALDACFSGAGGRSVKAKGALPIVAPIETALSPDSKITLFAAVACQESATLPEQGHGTFTYFFLKGLSGEARNADGVITPRGLDNYLKSKLRDAADLRNREQTPVLEKMDEGELFRF